MYPLAYYDKLTRLPNKFLFEEHLMKILQGSQEHEREFSLFYIDTNRFNNVNNSLGRDYGDKLLKHIAIRLTNHYNEVYRITGDEFLVILRNTSKKEVENGAQQLLKLLNKPFYLDHHQLHIDFNMGIAVYPDHGKTEDELFKNVNIALHYCKKNKISNYQYFKHEMNLKMIERRKVEEKLFRALENREFIVYYQPQNNSKTREIIGSEALIRWNSPDLGLVSPANFIPISEETGLINPIGKWVLYEACKQQKRWMTAGYPVKSMSVNLSVKQFYQDDLVSSIIEILNATELDPQYLILEITESVVFERADDAINKLKKLRNLGIKIALDDFGTGYSSLNYIKDLPIDILKIDKSFIQEMDNDPKAKEILKTIILLTKQLGIIVLAEGVETETHVEFLNSHQCNKVQGFLFSPPVPCERFQHMLEQGTKI